MDPVTFLLSALTVPAIYVGHVVLKTEIKTAWERLKKKLTHKDSNISKDDLEKFEKRPNSLQNQRALQAKITEELQKPTFDPTTLSDAQTIGEFFASPQTEEDRDKIGEVISKNETFQEEIENLKSQISAINEKKDSENLSNDGAINAYYNGWFQNNRMAARDYFEGGKK